jgi:dihydroorotate dehydrogenase electron transfer subunit
MPIDVAARVIANRSLSSDYNVLALDAPAIAREAAPGQFVMVKPGAGFDPLLRRPFSVFEVLRDGSGAPTGITILSKQIGPSTRLIYGARPDQTIDCLGPLGRPFTVVDPPTQGWMIAGGVGLAPFVTLAAALQARGTPATLFYGARRAEELYCVELFEALGATIVLSTEDGSRGIRGRVTVPLAEALERRPLGNPVKLYVCGPTPMMRACAQLANKHGRACDVSLEQVMGCGLGGCYSCVVLAHGAGPSTGLGAGGSKPHHTRTCIDGPVFDAQRIVWDAVAGH